MPDKVDTALNARGTAAQSGVGLIEVLIALLIFAVGVLGLAAMQLSAKRAGYEATQRSIATSLARDIIERMRANPNTLEDYVVDDLGAQLTKPSPDCGNAACDPNELAEYDLYEWSGLLVGASETVDVDGDTNLENVGGLVDSRACITNTDGEVSIAITWRGLNELTNPTDSACGEGLGLYGTNEVQRRLLFIETYIGTF